MWHYQTDLSAKARCTLSLSAALLPRPAAYRHSLSARHLWNVLLSKNAPDPLPAFVQTAVHENINYIKLQGLPELIWLGNLAALEFHPSLHYVGSELPCEWMIDLDPSLEIEPRIMEATAIVGGS